MSRDQRIDQSATSIKSLLNTNRASSLMPSHVRSALWTLPELTKIITVHACLSSVQATIPKVRTCRSSFQWNINLPNLGLKHHNQLYLFSGDGRRQFRRFEHVKSIPPQLVIFSLWDQSQFYSDRPSDYGAVIMAGAAATLGAAESYYSYGVSYFFKKRRHLV